MSKLTKEQKKKYIISSIICVAVAVFILFSKGFFEASAANKVRILSDAFTIPGILMILSALLVVVSNEGAFDSLAYTGKSLKRFFVPERPGEKRINYREYVEQRREKKVTGFSFMFVVGGIFTVIGLILVVVFYVM